MSLKEIKRVIFRHRTFGLAILAFACSDLINRIIKWIYDNERFSSANVSLLSISSFDENMKNRYNSVLYYNLPFSLNNENKPYSIYVQHLEYSKLWIW